MLESTEFHSEIGDHELDEVLRQIKTEFPNAGYRRVHSQLVSRGIRVSHLRVREAMHRCDPEGTAMRWLIITPRAKYCVSGPLALWHIDGNHKLIRHVRLLYYVITNYLLTKGEGEVSIFFSPSPAALRAILSHAEGADLLSFFARQTKDLVQVFLGIKYGLPPPRLPRLVDDRAL